MDNSKNIILDISSDEDVGLGETRVSFDDDDFDWMNELLSEVKNGTDDPDEVTVVGEVISNPKQMVTKFVDNDGDDDDCVILDGDPDKHVTFENKGEDDSEELCLVAEKGQVACRDYPHPRHLCVKFPFNSTPHERHCEQCHCYVCDSIAPCVHWGNGISSIDHCHAIDKDEFWKAQRKGAKTSREVLPFVSEVGSTPMNQILSLPNNPVMCDQELSASIPSSRIPCGVMPARTQEVGWNPNNKRQPCSVPSHLLRQNIGHPGIQFVSQRVPFKRPGIFGGTLAMDRYRNHSFRDNYGCQVSMNAVSRWQNTRERGNPVANTYKYAKSNFRGAASDSMQNPSTCSSMGNQIGNYAPSQPQSLVYSQTHNDSVSANSAVPCPQISSQSCTGSRAITQQWWESHLGSSLQDSIPQAISQQNVYQNVVANQPSVTSSHGNINYPSENPVNFSGETPIIQSIQSFPEECNQLQSSVLCENPAIDSTELHWSPISDPRELNSEYDTWSFEDLNFSLSSKYNLDSLESSPPGGGFHFD